MVLQRKFYFWKITGRYHFLAKKFDEACFRVFSDG